MLLHGHCPAQDRHHLRQLARSAGALEGGLTPLIELGFLAGIAFQISDDLLNLEANIQPGKPARVAFTPQKPGRYDFHCDVFCGSGHEGMEGTLVVVP